jgi:hypothetical protein
MNRRVVGVTSAALLTLTALAAVELACDKESAAATTSSKAAPTTVAAKPHVDGNHFTLDAAPTGDCAAGANCAVAIKLVAQAEYHINPQYPYKFTAVQAAGVTYLGGDSNGPHIFTKSGGDFAQGDAKTGTMTIKFKPSQKGTATIGGTFKMSVCSDQNCQLEQQDVSVDVTVK